MKPWEKGHLSVSCQMASQEQRKTEEREQGDAIAEARRVAQEERRAREEDEALARNIRQRFRDGSGEEGVVESQVPDYNDGGYDVYDDEDYDEEDDCDGHDNDDEDDYDDHDSDSDDFDDFGYIHCDHHGRWLRVDGCHRCEDCDHVLPQFILECRWCGLHACVRCRKDYP